MSNLKISYEEVKSVFLLKSLNKTFEVISYLINNYELSFLDVLNLIPKLLLIKYTFNSLILSLRKNLTKFFLKYEESPNEFNFFFEEKLNSMFENNDEDFEKFLVVFWD